MLRPTQNVDASGRIFHPILSGWSSTRPDASTIEVLRSLTGMLAVDPPFFPGSGRPTFTSAPLASSSSAQMMRPPPIAYGNPPQSYQTGPYAAQPYSSNPYARQPFIASPPPTSSTSPVPLPISPTPTSSTAPQDLPQLRKSLKAKLNSRYQALQRELALESDRLLAENTQLLNGEKILEEGHQKIRAELSKTQIEIDGIKAQTQRLIALSQHGTPIDYDNLVIPHGPIAKQIMDLVAEDLAIQDTIYAVSKVFLDGKAKFNLAVDLRYVRDLAREQFMAKALLAKIRREFPIINN
jgi:ESCRT-I complex subunit TSG101